MHGYDIHGIQGDRQGVLPSSSHLNGASRTGLRKLFITRLFNKFLYMYSYEKIKKVHIFKP